MVRPLTVAVSAPKVALRPFAILFALALVAAFNAVSGWAALHRHEILGTGYLPRGAVPLFLLLVLANAAVKKLFPSLTFSRSELAFVFALLTATVAIAGQ